MSQSREDLFRNLQFGMFLHWGLYSVAAGRHHGKPSAFLGEWIQAHQRIPAQEYEQYAQSFRAENFRPDEWVRKAREAGMKYLVFTAKHHDGFAMYHSCADRYNVTDATPFGRDPLAELAESCRKEGLSLGIYYSHYLDWHDPDAGG